MEPLLPGVVVAGALLTQGAPPARIAQALGVRFGGIGDEAAPVVQALSPASDGLAALTGKAVVALALPGDAEPVVAAGFRLARNAAGADVGAASVTAPGQLVKPFVLPYAAALPVVANAVAGAGPAGFEGGADGRFASRAEKAVQALTRAVDAHPMSAAVVKAGAIFAQRPHPATVAVARGVDAEAPAVAVLLAAPGLTGFTQEPKGALAGAVIARPVAAAGEGADDGVARGALPAVGARAVATLAAHAAAGAALGAGDDRLGRDGRGSGRHHGGRVFRVETIRGQPAVSAAASAGGQTGAVAGAVQGDACAPGAVVTDVGGVAGTHAVEALPVLGAVVWAGGNDAVRGDEAVLTVARGVHAEPLAVARPPQDGGGAHLLGACATAPAVDALAAHVTIVQLGAGAVVTGRLAVAQGAVKALVACVAHAHRGSGGVVEHTPPRARAQVVRAVGGALERAGGPAEPNVAGARCGGHCPGAGGCIHGAHPVGGAELAAQTGGTVIPLPALPAMAQYALAITVFLTLAVAAAVVGAAGCGAVSAHPADIASTQALGWLQALAMPAAHGLAGAGGSGAVSATPALGTLAAIAHAISKELRSIAIVGA